LNAVVAKQLSHHGVRLHPGESIRYVITDAKARDPDARARPLDLMDSTRSYDAEKYAELLLRAMATILQPAGLDKARLEQKITRTFDHPIAYQMPLAWHAFTYPVR
jgi:DNA polymerase elongation subunit (family B)